MTRKQSLQVAGSVSCNCPATGTPAGPAHDENCIYSADPAEFACGHCIGIAVIDADKPLVCPFCAAAPSAPQPQREGEINAMVDRFLRWPLPRTFAPDCGISFDKEVLRNHPHLWPSGTNLLNADEARQMIEYLLAAHPQAAQQGRGDACCECHRPFTAANVHTKDGWAETQISGMCEDCFDGLFDDSAEDYSDDDAPAF